VEITGVKAQTVEAELLRQSLPPTLPYCEGGKEMKFLMPSLLSVLLVISIGLVRSRQASDQPGIPADEYAVYAAVIGNMFAGDIVTFDTQSKVKMLVIEEWTVRGANADMGEENEGERLKQVGFSPILSQETIDDYVAKNAKSYQLTKSLDIKLKYTLIPKEKIEKIFDGLPSSEFYRQFPDSGGYIALSRAGLNTRADQALVYMHHICGGLCGSGHYLLLVKKNREWVVQQHFMSWVS
jgi:hypothetical protein